MRRFTLAAWLLLTATAFAADKGYDEAKALFDAGDYKGALAKLNTATPAAPKKGDAAPDARLPYLLLKGETMLRMKQRDGAASAFTAAADAAGTDKKARGEAMATALLLKQSPQLTYKVGEETVDIIPPENRSKAIAALFDARLKAAEPQITKAEKAKSLAPIVTAMKSLAELQLLELGSGSDGARTSAALAKLAPTVNQMVTTELRRIDDRVRALHALASETYILDKRPGPRTADNPGGGTVRRGLTSAEQTELRREIENLRGVDELTTQALALSTEADAASWKPMADQAKSATSAAQQLLTENTKK